MWRLSPGRRPIVRRLWIVLAAAMLGLGASWVWGPASVGITLAAAVVAFVSSLSFNELQTRLLAGAVMAAHGAAIAIASGSIWLGAAVALPAAMLMPGDVRISRWGYKAVYLFPVLALVGLGGVVVAWPAGAGGWFAVPGLVLMALVAVDLTRQAIDMKRRSPAAWPLTVGDPVPVFRATGRDGTPFDLEQERGRYLLFCFLRGDWCPVCHVMMRIYQRDAALLARHGVRLVAVSPLGGQEAVDFARDLGIEFIILVDEGGRLARQFGAVHPKADPNGGDTMLPASFLVDGTGIIRACTRSDDVGAFFAPQQVLQQLEKLAVA